MEKFSLFYDNHKCSEALIQAFYLQNEGCCEEENKSVDSFQSTSVQIVSSKFGCQLCKITELADVSEQRDHFKSDWHKFNVSRKSKNAAFIPLNEEEYERYLSDAIETNIELDNERLEEETYLLTRAINDGSRFYLISIDKQTLFSCYREILTAKTIDSLKTESPIPLNNIVDKAGMWVLLILAGGHFAGAVFDKSKCIIHKTLQRYTIRAKQGGAQAARDLQQSQNKPKSAGANLRRQNELALRHDVEQVLSDWQTYLSAADLIFLRYPTYCKQVFFGGKQSASILLNDGDSRIRRIPFTTKRPNLKEIERIHKQLSIVMLHGDKDIFLANLKRSMPPTRALPSSAQINIKTTSSLDYDEKQVDNDADDAKPVNTETPAAATTTTTKPATEKPKNLLVKKLAVIDDFKRKLYTACRTGDVISLQQTVDQAAASGMPAATLVQCLNSPVTGHHSKSTLLHVSASSGFGDIVAYLLRMHCDPSLLDGGNKTPYALTSSPLVRRVFQEFRRDYELSAEKYEKFNVDWSKTGIPEMKHTGKIEVVEVKPELTEKQRLAKKAKADRQRQKKLEKQQQEREEQEKHNFLALSDREKRALAAERRVLAHCQETGQPSPVLCRCFQCARDISGQIPFEYCNFTFCSTKCLTLHRQNRRTSQE